MFISLLFDEVPCPALQRIFDAVRHDRVVHGHPGGEAVECNSALGDAAPQRKHDRRYRREEQTRSRDKSASPDHPDAKAANGIRVLGHENQLGDQRLRQVQAEHGGVVRHVHDFPDDAFHLPCAPGMTISLQFSPPSTWTQL